MPPPYRRKRQHGGLDGPFEEPSSYRLLWGRCPPPYFSMPKNLRPQAIGANVTAWYGSMFSHFGDKFTIPFAVHAEIEADFGYRQLLESAVI